MFPVFVFRSPLSLSCALISLVKRPSQNSSSLHICLHHSYIHSSSHHVDLLFFVEVPSVVFLCCRNKNHNLHHYIHCSITKFHSSFIYLLLGREFSILGLKLHKLLSQATQCDRFDLEQFSRNLRRQLRGAVSLGALGKGSNRTPGFYFFFRWCTDSSQHGPNGENLAESYPNTTAAIEAWGNERSKYDFDRPTGFSNSTGHFTQLVWKDTKSVGCARKECGNGDKDGAHGWLVVCEYWPPGNVDGKYKSEVQAQREASNILGDVSRGDKKEVASKLLITCGLAAVAAGLRLF